MITKINKPRTLTKRVSCKCECKFHSKKCNSNQKWNNDEYQFECKNLNEYCVCKKIHIWNITTCSCKNGRYSGGIIGVSVVICDEITDTTKTFPTKRISAKTAPTKCTLTIF